MTRYFADGRPAEIGGKPVRYDAGGRPHMLSLNRDERAALVTRYGESEVAAAEMRELRLAGAQANDLARQLTAMRTVLKHGTAGHDGDCTCVACEALRVT